MKSKLVLLILICTYHFLEAQTNFNTSWICGSYGLKITFNGSNVDTFPCIMTGKFIANGSHANICDSNGRLILVSDGMNIYDSALNFIENGDTLLSHDYYINESGFGTYSQTSIFLPFEDGVYYLITPDASDSMFNQWSVPPFSKGATFDRLLYHKMDMKLNGGVGKVIEKAVPMLEHVTLSKSQMMACKHANGKDWWLIKQWSEENKIVKFLIKKDSIVGPTYQEFTGSFSKYDQSGQSMFSQDGTRYATTCRGTNKVFIADFNRCNGVFTKPIWINVPDYSKHNPSDTSMMDGSTQGLVFSPNGRFLYLIRGFNILQYDLQDEDSVTAWYHVAGLDTTWAQFQIYSNSYLGKNNKLYIGNFNVTSKELSVINAPDNKGALCGFCPKCLVLTTGWGSASTPPCMPNYDLGALDCTPIDSGHVTDMETLLVYPNPISDVLVLESIALKDKENEIVLYNVMGQVVYRKRIFTNTTKINIDIHSFTKGVYFLRTGDFIKRILKE